jgi:hypothetical protein
MLAGLNVKALAKQAALDAVMSNPMVKQATEVVGPVKALVDPESPKSLGHLQETLKTAVKETVDTKVASSLAAAGISPDMANPDSGAAAAARAAAAAGVQQGCAGGAPGAAAQTRRCTPPAKQWLPKLPCWRCSA